MIPFQQMRDKVLTEISRGGVRRCDVASALGYVLATDVVTSYDFPLFDNSAMDGFAVRATDFVGGESGDHRFEVIGVSSAGHPFNGEVGRGQAVRILTGAPMVAGADAVIPVEVATFESESNSVEFTTAPVIGDHIRRQGEILEAGSIVVEAGIALNAGHLGLMAAHGISNVEVVTRPSVAIISTGDELVPSTAEPGPGQIFESNTVLLEALLGQMGCEVRVVHVPDDRAAICSTLGQISTEVDMIISTGGVSMGGEYDALRNALDGFDVDVVQVAMKPAKPFAFGHVGEAIMFGLPGNPGSVLVSFESFVRPAVRKWSGVTPVLPDPLMGVTGEDLYHADDHKAHFIPVRRAADGRWVRSAALRSHSVDSLASAEALLRLDPDQLSLLAGSSVELTRLWR